MKSLYYHLYSVIRDHPHRPALRFENRELTFKELHSAILATVGKLTKLGIKKGDVVAINVPNCLEAVYLLFALNYIGAIAYFIHPLTKGTQMKEFLEKVNSKFLFCLDLHAEEYLNALSEDVKIITINPYKKVSLVKSIALDHLSKKRKNHLIDFYKLENTKEIPEAHYYEEKEPTIYLNTGGTSGEPKVVCLSNEALSYLALLGYDIMEVEDGKGIKMLTAIPLFHGFGLAMGVLTPLLCGAESVLMLKFSTKEAIKLLSSNKANVIIGVPALYNAILHNENFKGKACSNIIVSFIGGDGVANSLINRWEERIRQNGGKSHLHQGYGLTETVTVSHVNTDSNFKIGSVGRPLKGISQLILDPETHEILPPNKEGEIAISGPTLMNGYLFDEHPEKTITLIDEVPYVLSKDLGYIDEDGYLFFRSRLRRIAKVNGVGICPSDLEKLCLDNPAVKEAFAMPVKDVRFGEVLNLYLVLNKDSELTEQQVRDRIARKINSDLPIYFKPREIIFLEKLPHTEVGKIDINALTKIK